MPCRFVGSCGDPYSDMPHADTLTRLLGEYDDLNAGLFPTMLNLWSVWVPVQAINLTLVPLHNRVLVVNIVGVGWSMFMSWYGNRPVSK